VRYVELRFAPSLHTERGLSNARVLDAVCDGIMLAEAHLPITARVLVCALRHQPEKATELAELAWRYRLHGVVGFDLAGPEAGFGAARLEDAYDIVRARGLSCTVHAGEADGWQSIQASIRNCGANRIGHGVALTQNEELLGYVAARRIPVESCVTSNLQTKAVGSLEQHPIRRFFEEGVG
jgi:adenosine deaminase